MGTCEFCKKQEKEATRTNLKGLTWLSPDDKWICDSCLKYKMINVTNLFLS